MDVQTVITQVQDALSVKRVFGEPYERNGTTVIPVAKIQGGAGGGMGEDPRRSEGIRNRVRHDRAAGWGVRDSW